MGGGAFSGTLNNCVLMGNASTNLAGGACSNNLNNCTIVGNYARLWGGGGVVGSILKNCIVYFNQSFSDPNYRSSYLYSSCTTPAAFGSGNLEEDPIFLDRAGGNLRLTSGSPCINAANNADAPPGPDLDGNTRIFDGTVDMGAYELQGSPSQSAPYITVHPASQTVAVGSNATFRVSAGGTSPLKYQWRWYGTNLPGATTNVLALTNVQPVKAGPYFAVVTNAYGAATSSVAVLTVTNSGPPPSPGTHYVDVNSANPTAPYTTWATAARVIQDAVDAAVAGDEIVVTDGVYAEGGRAVHGLMTNRVAVDKPLRLRSVNGPQATLIQGRQIPGVTNGDGAIRCVYLANGSSLTGFTLTNGATRASGDNLTERSGGGLWCGNTGIVSTTVSIKNCVLAGNSAANLGGGAYQGILGDCSFRGNSAPNGGGTAWATLTNCTVAGNSAGFGGGVAQSWLSNCSLFTNTAATYGGGTCQGTLLYCTLSGNSAPNGGGAGDSFLTNCVLSGNWVSQVGGTNQGGGAQGCTLNNCLVVSNSATFGGGSSGGTLIGCTVAGNSASVAGGGIAASVLLNTIAYFNNAVDGSNYYPANAVLNYCCTTPQPAAGAGNISSDPLFIDLAHGNLRLQSNSPCIDAGSNTYVGVGVDLDWHIRIWNGTVDMGAYEATNAPAPTLPSITQQPASQSVMAGSDVTFTVTANGTPVLGYHWRHEGVEIAGATTTSVTIANVQFSDSGRYSVVVSNTAGQVTSTDAELTVTAPLAHYVDLNSPNPTPPYTTWATAARTIQDAVDAASALEEVVVTNGVYATGGRAVDGTMTNRVALTKRLTLRSVNGPEFTVIQGSQVPGTTNGDGAIRCVYLTNGANILGFTLTNGATRNSGDWTMEQCGGGIFSPSYYYYYGKLPPFASNCVAVGNSAAQSGGGAFGGQLDNSVLIGNSAQQGGGASSANLNNCRLSGNRAVNGGGYGSYYYGTLNNCVLTENSAWYGGGCYNGTLNNCTVVGNSAQSGGGASGMATNSFLHNCIIYYNQAPEGSNYFLLGGGWYAANSLTYCCTAPEALYSMGNFTNEPVFVDLAGGDFRLQATSPCIDNGNNSYAMGTTDLAGNPRIIGGVVDVGVYEFSGAAVRSTHYVSADSATPAPPYISWETAAISIQDAIDAAAPGDEIVVTNGLYATGARTVGFYDTVTNRVAVHKNVNVRSVNGPQFTVIAGSGDLTSPAVPRIRCVYLADRATLSGFTLTNGFVDGSYVGGGGVYCQSSDSVVSNCMVLNNVSFWSGGGVYGGKVQNSILKGNSVTNNYSSGGGASSSILSSCVLAGNTARGATQASGAGASGCTLYNCTLTGNETFAPTKEAAVSWCNLTNCIVYFNTVGGGSDYANSTLAYSCATPLPAGAGNISADPLFLDLARGNLRLSPNSPCLNAGNNSYVRGTTDLDGKLRISAGIVDLGAYETGGTVHYVDGNNLNPVPPYDSWASAATTIQEAVDVAVPGDDILVADGVYASGGRAVSGTMTNRVAVDKLVNVRALNGPEFTFIQGYQIPTTTNGDGAIRCVYLTNGASLFGFTLTQGATRNAGDALREQSGGGIFCESFSYNPPTILVSNCVIVGNSAAWSGGGAAGGILINSRLFGNVAGSGGGAFESTLNNCTLATNSAATGGGAYGGTLNNCTVVGNTGSGAYGYYWGKSGELCTLNNCIVYYNEPENYNTYSGYYSMSNSCTVPALERPYGWPQGSGNFTNAPLFVDLAAGDLRLQLGSPCINAGNNIYSPSGADLDGNPRIVGGTVDIGAYEFQGSNGESFVAWLQRYGFPTDGSADYIDSDNDGMNNWQEWRAGTNPTNAISNLRLSATLSDGANITLRWQSVPGVSYSLERASDVGLLNFTSLATNLPAQFGTNSYTDSNILSSPMLLYRVRIAN